MNNNNNNSNNCSNNNNTINSCNLKNNYNQWCNAAINLQQQQQQITSTIHPPMHQVRVSNWISDTNKMNSVQQQQQQQSQQHHHQLQQQQHQQQFQLMPQYNNNNNMMCNNNNNPNLMSLNQSQSQQQQQSSSSSSLTATPNYMSQQQQQQYQIYQQQQNVMLQQQQQQQQPQRPNSINETNNVYYQQQQQRLQQQQHQTPSPQQQQQRALNINLPMVHSPYNSTYSSSPSPTNMLMQQQSTHISPHHHQQQQHTMRRLVSMDGIQSGVPTLTTSTLTPTTLRNIEETFIQLTSEPIHPPFHAGFKPPSLANFSSANNNNSSLGTTTTSVSSSAAAAAASSSANSSMLFNGSNLPEFGDITTTHDSESEDESQSSWNAPQFNEDNSLATTENSSGATDTTSFHNGSNGLGGMNSTSNASSTNDFTSLFAATPAMAKHGANNNNNNNMLNNNNLTRTTPRRGVGGRRPTKPSNMSPEEEEKRRIRRERNKEAAARCRKRRVDQTNELLEEVAVLEKKREAMQKDIESLNVTKQELEYILEAHRPSCQKVRNDILTVNTFGGLIAPTTTSSSTTSSAGPTTTNTLSSSSVINNNNNNNNNNSISILNSRTLGGGNVRSMSPIDIKPVILHDQILNFIKNEPLESALDSNSSLDHDGPTSPKRQMLASSTNPMIPPPLPLPNVASITASLNTPNIVNNSSVSSFAAFNNSNATLNTLNALNNNNNNNNNNINNNNQQHHNHHHNNNSNIINKFGILGSKPRPNSLPTVPRHLALNVDGKQTTTTDINGVAIQTPSTGVFNFDSLMDGGTGLTPVSGPLIPTCSSQNKHPLELTTPTSEPSKLVSL